MTISAQGGVFGYAEQDAMVGRNGTFDHTDLTWYKVRSPRVSVGTIQDQQVFPLEIGGVLTPDGAFKQQYFFAGDADLVPRLENSLGILLKGAMGQASSVTGKNADGGTSVGVNTHIFNYVAADNSSLPWMAVRRLIPGAIAAQNSGETGFDCKVANVRITVPNIGKIVTRASFIGRDVELDDGSTWVWENAAFEDSSSTPDAGRGSFLIGGVEYPILGATIDLVNGLTNPRQEGIVGDFRPDTFTCLTRNAVIRIVYKYENDDLYRKLLTGTADGTDWNSLPFTQVSSAGGYAFDARFQSPGLIGVTEVPYELRIRANKVTWAVDGPPELAAGGFVTQSFVGTVLQPSSGNYLEMVMVNGQTSY